MGGFCLLVELQRWMVCFAAWAAGLFFMGVKKKNDLKTFFFLFFLAVHQHLFGGGPKIFLMVGGSTFFYVCSLKYFILERFKKNPTYGRRSISRPMRIVAPMPKEGGPRIPQNPIFFEKRKKSSKTQKLKNVLKYAKISDTPFDQRSLIHWEAWFPGGTRISKNPIFLKNGKNHPKRKNSKTSRDMPKLAIRPSTWGLWSIGKCGFHHVL